MNSLVFGGGGKFSDTKDASQCCLDMARSAFPVAEWLPKYRWRNDFVADFMAGLTVAVMHIPQGMAYAMLASVKPIVGLYTSFFPVLVYIMMGTSPHSSFGEHLSCLMFLPTMKPAGQYVIHRKSILYLDFPSAGLGFNGAQMTITRVNSARL